MVEAAGLLVGSLKPARAGSTREMLVSLILCSAYTVLVYLV